MGTGIVSILLNTLPYNGQWLYYISIIVFILNVAYFMVFLAITLLRYILYPEIFEVMVTHPVQSLFLGTFPMGLATIINMFCFVCVPPWGDGAAYFICGVWVFDAVVSVVVAIGIPFLLYWSLSLIIFCVSANANSQNSEEQWARSVLHDCCLASANCLVCGCGGVRLHRCKYPARRTIRPWDHPGQLYPLGNRRSPRDDGHLYIFAATDVSQASTKRNASKRVSSPWSPGTGQLWVNVARH